MGLGANTVVSQRSYLCTGTHDYKSHGFDITAHKIIIGDKCWLATDVYVAPGIIINDGTVVGARSSVFNDVPSGKICIGSPAIVIKDRVE